MTDYYVDTAGIGGTPLDSNPGTISEPWETISKANSELVAGDTVYIRAGTYIETINPTNTGNSGNIITYTNYNDEIIYINGNTSIYDGGKYMSYGIHLSSKNYINVSGIIFLKPVFDAGASRAQWFLFETTDHIYIKDCVFKDGDEDFRYSMSSMDNTYYTTFDNCSWDASNTDINSDTQNDLLIPSGISSHNLWTGCDFGNISHIQIYFTSESSGVDYNVFTNCTFHNKWRHGLATVHGAFLVENCVFYDFGTECHECPFIYDRCTNGRVPLAFYPVASLDSIFRNNILYDSNTPIGIGMQFHDTKRNWIYHNTIYNSLGYAGINDHRGILMGFLSGETTVYRENTIVNNIFAFSEHNRQIEAYNYNDSAYNPIDNVISHNLIYDDETNAVRWGPIGGTVNEVELGHSDWIAGTNIVANPVIVDSSTHNYNLQSNSPAMNAGTHLTTITSSTNTAQTVIVVDDASPFYSGAGAPWLIEGAAGDTIKTEGGEETVIQSLDYTTNTLTVSPAIDIVNGEGLSLTYTGTAPNIGVYQGEGEIPTNPYTRMRGINRPKSQYYTIGSKVKSGAFR